MSGEPNKTQLIISGNNGIAIWLTYYKSTKQLMASVQVDGTFSPEKCIAAW